MELAAFCAVCGTRSGSSGQMGKIIMGGILAAAAATLGYVVFRDPPKPSAPDKPAIHEIAAVSKPAEPRIIYENHSDALLNSQVTVASGSLWSIPFKISTDMNRGRVSGNFRASGGTGNDVSVVIANPTSFENIKNGHPAPVYYNSGRVTVGELNVPLSEGEYFLVFSNRFSLLTDKYVSGDIHLQYTTSRLEAPVAGAAQ